MACVRLTYCLLKYLLISGMDKVRVAVPKWAWSGHVTHFYILDLENFATASRWCNGVVNKNRRRSACGSHLRLTASSLNA